MPSLSQQIAHHVLAKYVEPARKSRQTMIEVNAGEVHRALGLKNRVASVCTTLESQKFQKESRLFLFRTTGPESGRSTTVSFIYYLEEPGRTSEMSQHDKHRGEKLKALYGISAKTFRELGGGEEFLRRERDWGPDAWERYEAEEDERKRKGAA